ncbi:ribbon-helix-helix protein, CopG family [Paracoccus onubensis]|uniref:ribbon-helix-helix protein, CopG family n=1 Tax=Paracoccus onubensis TaxID=1675788 RepID=UPI002730B54B|nr:ribbon-helix-helix protein, CopG family [Paracoccus onubensis]MDP0926537.1 ribbon-helix-helix protein, CopG family [Paracoccus onubensis]
MRRRLCLTLPADLLDRLDDLAQRKKLSRSAVAEAAIASFLSPDAQDMREAAFTRRLDRLSRQSARLERDLRIIADTLALFIRFWLTITPPLAAEDQAAAQVKGRERFESFVETLGRRLQQGGGFLAEIPQDVTGQDDPSAGKSG